MRVYNFGGGPATLPEEILQEVKDEFLDWQGLGVSIVEVGHRTTAFQVMLEEAEADLRDLLEIPSSYHVLFIGGSTRAHFAKIPMNLLNHQQQGAYLVTGIWSNMAYQEAVKVKKAYCLAKSTEKQVPKETAWTLSPDTVYMYYTPNETISGIRFPYVPKTGEVPLIADMTSCLLSEPIKMTDYGMIIAGSQKNIAPAGLSIVIVHESLLESIPDSIIPTMLDYRTHVKYHSLYATPPVFNCYMAGKMFKWLKQRGGVAAIAALNAQKAAKLYHCIDSHELYHCAVEPDCRSRMNVCFSLANPESEARFLQMASVRGLYALKGHRAVGGIRASLYNAMTMAGVDALVEFMQDFAKDI